MVKFTFYKVNSYFDYHQNKTLEQMEEGQEWCKYAYDKFEANQEKAKLHIVSSNAYIQWRHSLIFWLLTGEITPIGLIS